MTFKVGDFVRFIPVRYTDYIEAVLKEVRIHDREYHLVTQVKGCEIKIEGDPYPWDDAIFEKVEVSFDLGDLL